MIFSPSVDALHFRTALLGRGARSIGGPGEVVFGIEVVHDGLFARPVGLVIVDFQLRARQKVELGNTDVIMQMIGVGVLDDIDMVLVLSVPTHEKGDELFGYLSAFLWGDVGV
ncbi:hypothetical protein HCR_23400 (plasmid) [Hydrogenimonas cancrithermarum]|uniref:Uncharacterized protein n=1 Tax=Hydrogenimonas cancrithermarum TaxID=2993563 RepID=A0ABM8FNT2_9BACT|nr:hypothetical protein HCR_23400 [Hydrogenimonas cancrithermarum]